MPSFLVLHDIAHGIGSQTVVHRHPVRPRRNSGASTDKKCKVEVRQ